MSHTVYYISLNVSPPKILQYVSFFSFQTCLSHQGLQFTHDNLRKTQTGSVQFCTPRGMRRKTHHSCQPGLPKHVEWTLNALKCNLRQQKQPPRLFLLAMLRWITHWGISRRTTDGDDGRRWHPQYGKNMLLVAFELSFSWTLTCRNTSDRMVVNNQD